MNTLDFFVVVVLLCGADVCHMGAAQREREREREGVRERKHELMHGSKGGEDCIYC